MVDQKREEQKAKSTGWKRLGCWLWFRLIILLLVALLILGYFVEVIRCSYYKPTGDALYDRYARAVISRQSWKLFHGRSNHPTHLPDRVLAGWEGEFGDDPRYWQLRYFCAKYKGVYGEYSGGLAQLPAYHRIMYPWMREVSEDQQNAWQYLQDGVDRGATDWVTLELLGRLGTRHFKDEMESELEVVEQAGLDRPERKQALGQVLHRYEQLELDRLNSMVEVEPDQAWSYYWRAKYWMGYGESERALADLAKGNAAPVNRMSKVFPVSFLLERIEHGDSLGSDILAGAILEHDAWSSVPNWVKWKDVYKEAQLMVAMGGDTELLQELHLAACRLGTAEFNSSIEPSVASVLETMLVGDLLRTYGADLDYEQRKVALSMHGRARSAHYFWQSWSDRAWPYIRDYPQLHALSMMGNVIGVGGSQAAVEPPTSSLISGRMVLQFLLPRHHFHRALWLREQQLEGVEQLSEKFEQLEYVDLTTLAWPDEWGAQY